MEIDAILAGLAERDKWQSRLTALQEELRVVKTQRRRVAARMRRVTRELKRLQAMAEELVRNGRLPGPGGWGAGGSTSTYLPGR